MSPNALAVALSVLRGLDFPRRGLGARAYSVAVDEADRRVDDDLLPSATSTCVPKSRKAPAYEGRSFEADP
jgi:hypothetical protein